MYCYNCGKNISDNSEYCPHCGNKATPGNSNFGANYPQNTGSNYVSDNQCNESYNESMPPQMGGYYNPQPEVNSMGSRKSNSGDKKIIIIVSIMIALLLVVLGVFMYALTRDGKNEDNEAVKVTATVNENDQSEKSEEEDSADESSETAKPEKAPVFARVSTYNPNYTYKRMSDIYSSYQAPDDVSFELKEFTQRYNELWLGWVNNGDREIFSSLRSGTKAYGYAEKFASKTITETYDAFEVRDVRMTSTRFYVWTHEIINEHDYQKNTNTKKDLYWVYQIGQDMNGYYVIDYTEDPAYK